MLRTGLTPSDTTPALPYRWRRGPEVKRVQGVRGHRVGGSHDPRGILSGPRSRTSDTVQGRSPFRPRCYLFHGPRLRASCVVDSHRDTRHPPDVASQGPDSSQRLDYVYDRPPRFGQVIPCPYEK